MIRKLSAIYILAFLLSPLVFPQAELDSTQHPFSADIRLLGKAYGDSVVLRWAPTTPGAWSYLNKVGYILEKASFRDEKEFSLVDYQRLGDSALKPLPLEYWEPVIKNGPDPDLSSVAAQAIYGKSFSPTGTGLFDAADEMMNRYSFSLLSADLSAVTARALGLRFTDTEVEANMHYIYRVYPAVAGQNYRIDTAYLVIENRPPEPVPPPVVGQVYEGERNIRLSWDKELHEHVFTAYYIERSEDGRTFSRLTKLPYMNPESDRIAGRSTVFQYVDSVPVNYKPYYYRLIGITAFAEKSPPSKTVTAMGRDRTPPPPPANVKARQIGRGTVRITWEVPRKVADLDGFYIGRGDDLKTNFQPIHREKIPGDSTGFTDRTADILSGNYYVVAAVDTAGNGSISMVSYAAVVDSIPPLAPAGLTGAIDSAGVVTLRWKLGGEPDLAGYMVYFANSRDHVFSTVNRAPLADTVYRVTIQIRTLTRHVYYRLKAVDTRWNYSAWSDIIELSRPDVIPPTSPVFSNYRLSPDGMWLEWIPSASEDVNGYDLEIRENGQLIKKVFVGRRTDAARYDYTQRDLSTGSEYRYTVSAVDESGLKSEPSTPVTIRAIDMQPKPEISDLAARVEQDGRSVTLSWSFQEPEKIERWLVYRCVEGTPLVTYKSISPDELAFTDRMLRKGVRYNYSVKAVYPDGRQTPFSNIVSAGIQ